MCVCMCLYVYIIMCVCVCKCVYVYVCQCVYNYVCKCDLCVFITKKLPRCATSSSCHSSPDPVLTVLYSGPLHAILKGLAESILLSSSSSSLPGVQRVRAYLYGSLLSFLHLTSERPAHNRAAGSLWEPHSREGLLRDESFSLLNSFGEPLMETVCRDACNGQEVCRVGLGTDESPDQGTSPFYF